MEIDKEKRLRRIAYNRQYYSKWRRKRKEQKAAAAIHLIDKHIDDNKHHTERQMCEIKNEQ